MDEKAEFSGPPTDRGPVRRQRVRVIAPLRSRDVVEIAADCLVNVRPAPSRCDGHAFDVAGADAMPGSRLARLRRYGS